MTSTPDVRDQPAATEARTAPPETHKRPPVSRRGLLGAAGAGLAGLAAGAGRWIRAREPGDSFEPAAGGGNAYLSLLRGAPGGHSHSGTRSTALRRI